VFESLSSASSEPPASTLTFFWCWWIYRRLSAGHGGTNFGFWSGANGGGGDSYQPHETSYDYDSPVSEGGEHGYNAGQDKYNLMQAVLGKYAPPTTPEPPLPPRVAYGALPLTEYAPLLGNVRVLSPTRAASGSAQPPFAESVGCWQGFLLYSTLLPGPAKTLTLNGVRDRAQVFVDGVYLATVYRVTQAGAATINLPASALFFQNVAR
jgi:beta-galactosidase